MTPEEKARRDIDRQLDQCGWLVQDRSEMNISAGPGVAVREFPMITGEADYLLYADGKAIGVVEAKPEGHTLAGVETPVGQVRRRPARRRPGPPPAAAVLLRDAPGAVTQFTNLLEPDARSREVFTFHRPEELLRLVGLERAAAGQAPGDAAARTPRPLAGPDRGHRATWRSRWPQNRPRSLIQMATGSGKTFTAVSSVYRLIKFAGARRMLFLVDRDQPRPADLPGVPAVRQPVQRLQVHRRVQRPAPRARTPSTR